MFSSEQKKVVIEQAGAALAAALLAAVRLTTPDEKLHDVLEEFYEGIFNDFEDRLMHLGMDAREASNITIRASEYGDTWLNSIIPYPPPKEPPS